MKLIKILPYFILGGVIGHLLAQGLIRDFELIFLEDKKSVEYWCDRVRDGILVEVDGEVSCYLDDNFYTINGK